MQTKEGGGLTANHIQLPNGKPATVPLDVGGRMIGCLGEKVERLFGSCVGRWFGRWFGGGLEAGWEVVWRLGEVSGKVPGEVSGEIPGELSGDASGKTLGDSSRTAWASKNAVFLQCIVASAESCKSMRKDARRDVPGPNKSTKTQREGNCIRTRITCPRHGGGSLWKM